MGSTRVRSITLKLRSLHLFHSDIYPRLQWHPGGYVALKRTAEKVRRRKAPAVTIRDRSLKKSRNRQRVGHTVRQLQHHHVDWNT